MRRPPFTTYFNMSFRNRQEKIAKTQKKMLTSRNSRDKLWTVEITQPQKGGKTMMQFDYSALRGRIREKGYTQQSLAEATNISMTQLSAKLNGRFPFKQTDIQVLSRTLDIQPAEIGRYFFTV
jgi:hypothetical protein